jgi:hypothetical protein
MTEPKLIGIDPSEDSLNFVRMCGYVVLPLPQAKLLQLQVKSGAFCNPTQQELDRIDSEISKTQSAMRGER